MRAHEHTSTQARGARKVQGATEVRCCNIVWATRHYKSYKELQGATRGYKELQGRQPDANGGTGKRPGLFVRKPQRILRGFSEDFSYYVIMPTDHVHSLSTACPQSVHSLSTEEVLVGSTYKYVLIGVGTWSTRSNKCLEYIGVLGLLRTQHVHTE